MNLASVAISLLAIAVGSLVKGATGLGLPVVAVPVMSYFFGLPHAIGILIIPIIATNLHQVVQTRAEARYVGFLWPVLGFGTVGIAFGTWLLTVLSPERLNGVLGGMLLFYIGMRVFTPHFALSERTGRRLAVPVGLLAGTAQGATGLCAAVFVPFVHSLGLTRTAMIFCVSTVFLIYAVVQFVSLLLIGQLSASHLVEGALAMLPVAVFMPLGTWIGRRLSRQVFDRVFLAILTLIALSLIHTALA